MLDGFVEHIQRLIDQGGRDLTLRTIAKSGSFFDPTNTPTDTTVRGMVFDYEVGELDGSVIQRQDKEILISTIGTVINKDDTIVDNGVEYNIINLEEAQPGPDKLVYIIQGRA